MLLIISCGKESGCDEKKFNESFEAEVGETICLEGDNSMIITGAFDALCPCIATCIWEGHIGIYVDFEIDGNSYKGVFSSRSDVIDDEVTPEFPDEFDFDIIEHLPAIDSCGPIDVSGLKWTVQLNKQ